MTFNYTLNFYNGVAFYVPLAFLLSSPVTIVTLGIIAVAVFNCCFEKKERQYLYKFLFNALKQIYGDYLEEENSQEKSRVEISNSASTYTLFNRELPRGMLLVLFITVACIYFCTIVSFWSELLIEESSQCDRRLDCFAFNETTRILVQQDPLDNCKDYEDAGFIIQCYSLAFNYINAIGNAGSVLVIGFLVMNTQSALFAGALSLKNKWGKRALGFVICYSIFGTILFIVLVPVLIVSSHAVKNSIFHSNNSYVQFFAYYITFLIAYVMSGPVFILAPLCQRLITCHCCSFTWYLAKFIFNR